MQRLMRLAVMSLFGVFLACSVGISDAQACRDYDGHHNSNVPPDCGGGDASGSYGGGSAEGAIRAAWPASLEDTAIAVATCESGLDPTATNPTSGAYGLFQFLPSTSAALGVDHGALADPYYAASEAYELYLQSGWSPWVCA